MPDQKGQTIKKKKVGVWKFYEEGKLVLEFDYDTGRVIFQQSIEDRSYYCIKGSEWIPVAKLEVYPRFKGSYIQFYEEIYETVKYPRLAQENGVEGAVFLSFDIDESGQAVNPEIHNEIGYGLDKEVLRVFEKVNNQWIPAVKDGKTLTTKFVVPFVFNLFDSDQIPDISEDLPHAALLDGVKVTLIDSKSSFR